MLRIKDPKYINNNEVNIEIDFVISWVDTSKNKEDEENKISKIDGYSIENLRYGNRDTLKYVLRGIYKNIPWVRKIYLITKSQWPEWLDEKKAKNMKPPIIRVDETEIHPEGKYCNGSIAVEACMFRIKDLSEFFLYSNDDMFICKPMKKNDWMFDNNISYVFPGFEINNLSKKNSYWYDNGIIDQIHLFNEIYPENSFKFFLCSHAPTILCKKSYEIIAEKLPNILNNTFNINGRNMNDLVIGRILNEYISLYNGWSKKKKFFFCYFNYNTDYSNMAITSLTQLLCTNLNCNLPDEKKVDYYKFMDNIFPDKLEFEI